MSELNELNKFYRSAINAADLTADEDGLISGGVFLGELKAATVSGRRLVLPTQNNLNHPDPNSIMRIHPLKENVIKRGESQVLQALRNWSTRRAYATLTSAMTQLLALALDNDRLPKLRPAQAEVLKHLSDVDESSVDRLVDLIEAASNKHAEFALLGIYVRRPGPRIGTATRRINRVGAVTFPLYTRIAELWEQEYGEKIKLPKGQKHVKDKRDINGVALRRVDIELYKRLFEAILPEISEPRYWVTDVDTDVGPSYIALMLSIAKLAKPLTHIANLYGDVFEHADKIAYDLDWVAQVENPTSLNRLADSVPMQAGNEGALAEESAQPPSVLSDNAIKPVSVEAQAAAPVAAAVATAPATQPAQQQQQRHPLIQEEKVSIVLPERAAQPRPAKIQVLNAAAINGTAASLPLFNGGQGLQPERPKSLYEGSRLPTLSETAAVEQASAMQEMIAKREQALRQFQQQQPVQQQQQVVQPLNFNQPVQSQAGAGQVIINGQVFQAVGPAGPQPGQPLTLDHLVPRVNTNNFGGQQNGGRQVPVFGTTVTGPVNNGGFNNSGGFNNNGNFGGGSLM